MKNYEKVIMKKTSVEEMEKQGFIWGKVRLQITKNISKEFEAWKHQEKEIYVEFKI